MTYPKSMSANKNHRKALYTKDDIIHQRELFFDKLKQQLRQSGIDVNEFNMNKLSDGTLNLKYKSMQIGRVKFSRFGHTIQVLTPSVQHDIDVDWFKGISFEKLIVYIPRLVHYAKYLKTFDYMKRKSFIQS